MNRLESHIAKMQRGNLRWFVVATCSLFLVLVAWQAIYRTNTWLEWAGAGLAVVNIMMRVWRVPDRT
jgi:hypothetical protein